MNNQATTAPAANTSAQFLNNLRARTAIAHEALEAHPFSKSITSPNVSLEDYVRYLRIMHQVAFGMEKQIYPALHTILPDIDQRRKVRWLAEDLENLDTKCNFFPPFPPMVRENYLAHWLGAFYVLEGSTLGGRVILKSLPTSLPISPARGTRYFTGYGKDTGPLWQHFLSNLTQYAIANQSEEEIIEGAKEAFASILHYFNYCQEYEARGHRQP